MLSPILRHERQPSTSRAGVALEASATISITCDSSSYNLGMSVGADTGSTISGRRLEIEVGKGETISYHWRQSIDGISWEYAE